MTTRHALSYSNSLDTGELYGSDDSFFHARILRYPSRANAVRVEPTRRRIEERVVHPMNPVPYELRDGMLHHGYGRTIGPLPATIGAREVVELGTVTSGKRLVFMVRWRCNACGNSRRTYARQWQSAYHQAITRGNISEAACARCHRKRNGCAPAAKRPLKDMVKTTRITAPMDSRARGFAR